MGKARVSTPGCLGSPWIWCGKRFDIGAFGPSCLIEPEDAKLLGATLTAKFPANNPRNWEEEMLKLMHNKFRSYLSGLRKWGPASIVAFGREGQVMGLEHGFQRLLERMGID